MVKFLLMLMTLFLISCGGEKSSSDSGSNVDSISTQKSFEYQAVLEVADANSTCFFGSLHYIHHDGKTYRVSDYSSQSFKDTLDKVFENETSHKPFESGSCYNKYNFQFNGKFTKEMMWVSIGEEMTDVIQVESFNIE